MALDNLAIAQAATLRPIAEIAAEIGLLPEEIELYGRYKAKVALGVRQRLRDRPNGVYVDVTAITPSPLGEGKTTVTVGLAQGLQRLGRRAIACIRQPTLGPVFGIKGGAAGGGYAQILPMEDFNLHLTGDNYAVTVAHNLLAAFIDNHLHHRTPLGQALDPASITWRRVTDLSDRALREVVIGLGGRENGPPRESGFDITAASEVMAILALTTGPRDLRERLGRIVVGLTYDRRPVTAEDLGCAGAMALLLKDALQPNLLQTLEGGAAFVHAGPFGNIAHGNSSILADQIALKLADFCVTESGFGADLGMEKFADIKCRASGLRPDVAVLVCTVRAIKAHSGRFRIVAGRPLDPALSQEDLAAVEEGAPNLVKQIANARCFGVPVVVAVNRHASDSDAEVALLLRLARQAGATAACQAQHYAHGGAGAEELAQAVIDAATLPRDFRFLYPLEAPLREKIATIATRLYGAREVSYAPEARRAIERITRLGYGGLPVCMAKTHLSLSHDPNLKGAPSGFTLPVRDVRLSAGAGFVYALCGEMRTMPGLPSDPAGEHMDVREDGTAVGLF